MDINSLINIYLPSIALFILFIFLVIEWKNDVELRKRMKDMNFFERNYIFPNYFYIYTAIWTITLLMLLIHEPFFYFMFLFYVFILFIILWRVYSYRKKNKSIEKFYVWNVLRNSICSHNLVD